MQPPFPIDSQQALDVAFEVPFTHRLRFTTDAFGDDWPVILQLLAHEETPARVQVWLDAGLTNSDQQLLDRMHRCFQQSAPNLQLTSEVQLVEGGESVKNDETFLQQVLKRMEGDGLDRRSYVLVVGGGAILDAIGFAAAIAHRGIRLIRIPSTTLAQADSGVGVKTAINAFGKKNWKGAFAVPWGVVNDQHLLLSLPNRDFVAGFSEAVKVALLKSRSAFQQLELDAPRIAQRNMPCAVRAIRESVLMHLRHITHGGDPFEVLEARPLDYGHWSAHKLEVLSNYELRHGEAVSIGVALDTAYSSLKFGLPPAVVESTLQTLTQLGLPIFDPWLESDEIAEGLEEFRQHLGGRLTLTMLRDIGDPLEVHEVDMVAMREAAGWLRIQARS